MPEVLNAPPPESYMRLSHIQNMLGGISRTKFYEIRMADPSFPKHHLSFGQIKLWRRSDVDRWLELSAMEVANG